MWSKLLIGYLKRIYKVILWFLLAIGCFALVFFLYGEPVSAVGYAALLCAAAALGFLAFDFWRYSVHHKKVISLCGQEYPQLEELPAPFDLLEEDYQRLVLDIYERKRRSEREFSQTYADLTDYYTLWVHQIKTPISALNLLLETEESENSKDMAMELFKIEQYTDMVLQYLRLGTDASDFVFAPCSLDEMVRQALRKYAKMFIGRKISLEFQETGLTVLTDEKWMVFVIEQLLSNALKYTNTGKVKIYGADPAGICIEDTGIGISAEDLPRIFEKGYTGFNGRMDKKATGLGLYLCRQILDRLSCRIAVESERGKGTRVTVFMQSI
ncbi:MAG: sensor histidine kinase [Eubacteriales bacterium]|nr:sensor histidine kinase [Eubacteriales bacterium]